MPAAQLRLGDKQLRFAVHGLLKVVRGARAAGMPVLVLLNPEVPYVPGVRTVIPQYPFLGGRGKQPVPRHTNILSTNTDISGEVKRRSLPRPTGGVSTPQS
jgi:hypothetical protein